MAQSRTTTERATSLTVVDVGLRATLNGQVYASRVRKKNFSGDRFVRPVLPKKAVLNGVLDVTRNFFPPRPESQDTNNKKKALEREVPTADLLRRLQDLGETGEQELGYRYTRANLSPITKSKMVLILDRSSSTSGPRAEDARLVFQYFSLQSVTESDDERYQIHETFAGEVMFVFGRRPRIWTLAGVVVNGAGRDSAFADQLLEDYDKIFRGTRSVDDGSRTIITYENVVIDCTLVGLTVARSAQMPNAVNVSMTIAVHDRGFMGQAIDAGTDAGLAKMLLETSDAAGFDVDNRLTLDELRTKIGQQAVDAQIARSAQRKSEADQNLSYADRELADARSASAAASGETFDALKKLDDSRTVYENALADGDEEDIANAARDVSEAYAELERAEAREQEAQSTVSDAEAAQSEAQAKADAAKAENDYWQGVKPGSEKADAEKVLEDAGDAAAAAAAQAPASGSSPEAAAAAAKSAEESRVRGTQEAAGVGTTGPVVDVEVDVSVRNLTGQDSGSYEVSTTVRSADDGSVSITTSGGEDGATAVFSSREELTAYLLKFGLAYPGSPNVRMQGQTKGRKVR